MNRHLPVPGRKILFAFLLLLPAIQSRPEENRT